LKSRPRTNKAKLIKPLIEVPTYDDPMIKYDPKDRGCKREGLRVRRFCRAWWIHSADKDKYAIEFRALTFKTAKKQMQVTKELKKCRLTRQSFFPNMKDHLHPDIQLQKLKEYRKSGIKPMRV
jgi:hypothetical protein